MLIYNKMTFWGAVLLSLIPMTSFSQPNYPMNPEKAQLIYSDVSHFVEALEQLESNSDTLAVLTTNYFDRASTGLKEYIVRHNLTAEMLMEAIRKYPERYRMISGFLKNITTQEDVYREHMKLFHGVLPSSMYPPTYLLVGANRGIAQASKVGQLVTITRVVDRTDVLYTLIVHELAHFQQAMTMGVQRYGALYNEKENMLGLCMREGGAEFITSLVLGRITQTKSLEYFQNNATTLKTRFKNDLKAQDIQYWMWDSIEDPDSPKLLGYVMGYEICKAYYEKKEDKAKALEQILVMDAPEKFLEETEFIQE